MKIHFLFLLILLLLQSCCGVVENPVKNEGDEELPALSDAEERILKKFGGEVLPDKNIKLGNIIIHRRERELSFPANVCVTQSGEYGIEVLISLKNGRVHEALLVTDVEPLFLQLSLYLIGAENGARYGIGDIVRQGSLINIDVQPKEGERVPIEEWLEEKEKSAQDEDKRMDWVFVGSSYVNGTVCLAKEEGNIVNVMSCGNTILDNPDISGDSQQGIGVNEDSVPARDTPVTVYFTLAKVKKK